MRAAIYARYSSEMQKDASIEDQLRLCRERAKQDSWTVVSEYSDRATSGSSMQNRPGLQTLMRDSRGAKFDVIICESLDRLSRDQEDIAGMYKRLRHVDIEIVSLAEGVVTELHIGLKGTMNALFLRDLAHKIRRGQRGRVEIGRFPGGISYGYEVVRELTADGTVEHGKRRINPAQAIVIQRIYDEYAVGRSPRMIAAGLNRDRVPSPRHGNWNASTINGNRGRGYGILQNELYRGTLVYNRVRMVRDPETGKRLSRLNPENKWIRRGGARIANH